MSRPRFLADHDVHDRIVDGLTRREPAIEIHLARDLGLADKDDPEVLAHAAAYGLIIVSHDVNTMTKHATPLLPRAVP